MHLTVLHDFSANAVDYKKGDKITDPDLMASVMKGENHTHVIRTADLPAPHNED